MTHEEFLHHFKQVRGRTMNLARCIPADKVEWRPEQTETSRTPSATTAH
jgi:hypothetical protein